MAVFKDLHPDVQLRNLKPCSCCSSFPSVVVLQQAFQHWLGILKQIRHGLELRNADDAEKSNLHNLHAFQ